MDKIRAKAEVDEDSIKRLPCKICGHYDSDTKECDMGNNPKEDNDPVQGCWDFL